MIDSAESEISRDDLERYGFDPQALHPTDDGLSSVLVEDVSIVIPRELLEHLAHGVRPLEKSNSFGIDLYQ